MAIASRKPERVIHHSDKGSQSTSWAFGHRCRAANVRPSTGPAGGALDDAMCESSFATLECEQIDRHRFAAKAASQIAVFRFIESFYDPSRRHSSIRCMSSAEFEAARRPHRVRTGAPEPENCP